MDQSAYQGASQSELETKDERLYQKGIRGMIIKLTQGYIGYYPYENSYAATQYRAWHNVMTRHGHSNPNVGFYDYAIGLNGAENAKYFLAWLNEFKMSKDTVVALDFEDPSVGSNYEVNQWLKVMKDAGFVNRVVYSMASWFSSKISPVAIQCNNFWLASYSPNPPQLAYFKYYKIAWQYTDNFKGMGEDASIDYGHILIPDTPKKTSKPKKSNKKVTKPENKKPAKKDNKKPVGHNNKSKPNPKANKPSYAKHGGIFTNRLGLNEFSDPDLKNKVGVLPAKSKFKALPVANGGVTRLMLDPYGIFISGNLNWVSRIK